MSDLRSRIADEISSIQVGSGYESTTIGITAALEAADALIAAGVVAEEPEAPRIITNETEANALPVGSIIRDNMGDARQKVSDRGWEQSGVVGWWGPTWVAFPAEVVWVPVKQEGTA